MFSTFTDPDLVFPVLVGPYTSWRIVYVSWCLSLEVNSLYTRGCRQCDC